MIIKASISFFIIYKNTKFCQRWLTDLSQKIFPKFHVSHQKLMAAIELNLIPNFNQIDNETDIDSDEDCTPKTPHPTSVPVKAIQTEFEELSTRSSDI